MKTMTPGPSSIRLDLACQRAGIRFHDAVRIVRSGKLLGFVDPGGYWYISKASIEILKKLAQSVVDAGLF